MPIFMKLYTYFLHDLEICMWFGYNPWIIFVTFFSLCELCHFLTSDSIKVYRQWVPCKLLIQIHTYLYATLHIFFPDWRCACGLDLILQLIFVTCHFSALLTSSFFKFLQVRHQLHWSLIYIWGERCLFSKVNENAMFRASEFCLNAGSQDLFLCTKCLTKSIRNGVDASCDAAHNAPKNTSDHSEYRNVVSGTLV